MHDDRLTLLHSVAGQSTARRTDLPRPVSLTRSPSASKAIRGGVPTHPASRAQTHGSKAVPAHCAPPLFDHDHDLPFGHYPTFPSRTKQSCSPAAAAAAAAEVAAVTMDPASEELERRSRYLSSLIRRTKLDAAPPPHSPPLPPPEPETKLELELGPEPSSGELGEAKAVVEKREVKEGDGKGKEKGKEVGRKVSVRVRAADMPLAMQRRAIRLAHDAVAAAPRVDGKRLALALKKEFDTSYGPAWHCIVGTSFGSYVTHSLGGFLYFSVDKVYILLFRTAVEPLGHRR